MLITQIELLELFQLSSDNLNLLLFLRLEISGLVPTDLERVTKFRHLMLDTR